MTEYLKERYARHGLKVADSQLDNLASCHSSLTALLGTREPEATCDRQRVSLVRVHAVHHGSQIKHHGGFNPRESRCEHGYGEPAREPGRDSTAPSSLPSRTRTARGARRRIPAQFAAHIARQAAADFPERVTCLDSASLSLGLGFQVLAAAEAAARRKMQAVPP